MLHNNMSAFSSPHFNTKQIPVYQWNFTAGPACTDLYKQSVCSSFDQRYLKIWLCFYKRRDVNILQPECLHHSVEISPFLP